MLRRTFIQLRAKKNAIHLRIIIRMNRVFLVARIYMTAYATAEKQAFPPPRGWYRSVFQLVLFWNQLVGKSNQLDGCFCICTPSPTINTILVLMIISGESKQTL